MADQPTEKNDTIAAQLGNMNIDGLAEVVMII